MTVIGEQGKVPNSVTSRNHSPARVNPNRRAGRGCGYYQREWSPQTATHESFCTAEPSSSATGGRFRWRVVEWSDIARPRTSEPLTDPKYPLTNGYVPQFFLAFWE
jgi:hypothetical protein